MKEATTEPIEMSLAELFQFALNIEESAINPAKDSEGNTRNSKEQKTDTSFPRKQGGVKVKTIRIMEEKLLFWKVKNCNLVIIVVEKATPKQRAALSKTQWTLRKRTPRTEVLSEKRTKLKNRKLMLQMLQLQNKKIVLVMKKKMTRTKRLLWKVFWPLGNLLKNIRKPRRINANVVIMILATLSKTIHNL
jgi:hypothetical protein